MGMGLGGSAAEAVVFFGTIPTLCRYGDTGPSKVACVGQHRVE